MTNCLSIPRRLVVATASAAALASLAVSACGTSYPRAWCGPVLGQLDNGKESVTALLRNLQHEQNVPLVARYRADTVTFIAAEQIYESEEDDVISQQSVNDLQTANRDGKKWKADKAAIQKACGV